jgi:hypothetical protein
MALVSDLIQESFLDLNEITVGRTIAVPEQTDAFMRINQLLDEWSAEQLMVPTAAHVGYVLTPGTIDYTLGVGAAFVTATQPIRVFGAAATYGNFRSGVKVMSFERFDAEISDPLSKVANLTKFLAADGSSPFINLRVHPVPAATAGTLWLDYWMALTQFATVGDTVNMPVGFQSALHWGLALKLHPLYARPGAASLEYIAAQAAASKAKLAELNAAILDTRLGIEPGAPARGGQGQA